MAGVNPNLLLEAEEVSLGGPPPQAASSATKYYENMEELLLVDSVDYSSQNVAVLSVLLALALIANLSAFPVILFRRTRFGNGQFACLILCLTVSDLLTVSCGLLGGLILEAGDMAWLGSSGGCAVYYFITSWLVGLSNYLVVCLVCMILVKRAASVLARLHECKYLLLSLVVITVLPAIPELFIRSTVVSFGQGVCILSTRDAMYALYILFKLLLRHLLPVVLVLLCLFRPRTFAAKRISLIFLGEPAVCECGPSGAELTRPHECPKMARSRPDILRDTESRLGERMLPPASPPSTVEKTKKSLPLLLEDPVRRRYKAVLTVTFIITSGLYIIVDVIFQIQSAVTSNYLTSAPIEDLSELAESAHEANLATALYLLIFAQQIINPCVFLYSEFRTK